MFDRPTDLTRRRKPAHDAFLPSSETYGSGSNPAPPTHTCVPRARSLALPLTHETNSGGGAVLQDESGVHARLLEIFQPRPDLRRGPANGQGSRVKRGGVRWQRKQYNTVSVETGSRAAKLRRRGGASKGGAGLSFQAGQQLEHAMRRRALATYYGVRGQARDLSAREGFRAVIT